jgi:hypothetical protein
MRNWIDFAKLKFQWHENIEKHCMELELKLNSDFIELNSNSTIQLNKNEMQIATKYWKSICEYGVRNF